MTTPESTRPVGAADEAAARRAAARSSKPANESAGPPRAEEPAAPEPSGWSLTKTSGVLALVSFGLATAGALVAQGWGPPPPVWVLGYVVAAVGGVIALLGRRALVPWLLLAGAVLAWFGEELRGSLSPYGSTMPVDLPSNIAWMLRGYGLFRGGVLALSQLSLVCLLTSVVTAFAGMLRRDPAPTSMARPAASGVAVLSSNGTIPAGWYVDPDGKPSERYWDGEAWADLSRPTTAGSVALRSQSVVGRASESVSTRSRTVAALLCFFVGIMGVHRFYAGKVGTGLLMLVTLGGLGIWVLIDFIRILSGSFKDGQGSTLVDW